MDRIEKIRMGAAVTWGLTAFQMLMWLPMPDHWWFLVYALICAASARYQTRLYLTYRALWEQGWRPVERR